MKGGGEEPLGWTTSKGYFIYFKAFKAYFSIGMCQYHKLDIMYKSTHESECITTL